MVAVQKMKLDHMTEKGLAEVKSEIDALSKIHHRHLLSLLGFYLDDNERLLVYEFMPKGTLSEHLFGRGGVVVNPLDWITRLRISVDIAKGIDYLHSLATESYIHRDLKPSNILLGDDLRAKLANFGLLRLAPSGTSSATTRVIGTLGYIDPEYHEEKVSTKADVYSFGIILMELITGLKALDKSRSEESSLLAPWFQKIRLDKGKLVKVIDSTIAMNEETLRSIQTVALMAARCCNRNPKRRPDMSGVLDQLSLLLREPAKDAKDSHVVDIDMMGSFSNSRATATLGSLPERVTPRRNLLSLFQQPFWNTTPKSI
ncbi:receptor protein kinase TMK1-like isoform X2 [Papaver somniferum]|uniref:receptor protein kinase TMK1-like isoform X2 n=1 Tax=Papaver somniferum TaxID=3469 RepID=UPI000E700466|nr:receptor protein kinase TMK1-like isoform X2 [Papaver somniferum]